jgi:hypothetical protein
MKTFQVIVRYVCTVVLVFIVWRHSHWSVALSISLLSIGEEVAGYVSDQQIEVLRELIRRLGS